MRALLRFSVLALLVGTQVSCLPVGDTADGSSLLTCAKNGRNPQIYGKWKKITGYGPDQVDEEELSDDFDLMVIPPGTHMCETKFVNRAQQAGSFRYHATYAHLLRNRELDIRLTATGGSQTGLTKGATYEVEYTIGCDSEIPKLATLRFDYSNGDVETYQLWSSSVGANDCGRDPDGD